MLTTILDFIFSLDMTLLIPIIYLFWSFLWSLIYFFLHKKNNNIFSLKIYLLFSYFSIFFLLIFLLVKVQLIINKDLFKRLDDLTRSKSDKFLLFIFWKETNNKIRKKNKDLSKKSYPSIEFIVIIFLLLLSSSLFFNYLNKSNDAIKSIKDDYKNQLSFQEFYKEVKDKKITPIKIWFSSDSKVNYFQSMVIDKPQGLPKEKIIYKLPYEKWDSYKSQISELKEYLWVWFYKKSTTQWGPLIWSLVQILLFVWLWFFLYKQSDLWNTKWKIKKFDWKEDNKVTFDSIWWIESIKEDITDTINSLKRWWDFQKRGVRLIRWILFYWPAWVWKTMIAKAIASELWIDLFIATWNDFRWAYISQWASKVHSTFKRIREDMKKKFKKIERDLASKDKLSILFIDEIDTIFKKRGTWHSEDDTVVNAFLHEMDGIEWKWNIIVIWATNHLEKIDDALLSRIDKKIAFKLPTRKERLDISTKIIWSITKKDLKIQIEKDLDLNVFSANTQWLSGRDIDNILNEAHRKSIVTKEMITKTFIQKVFSDYLLWKDSTWIEINKDDKEVVTYHELGHWVIWYLNWKTVHTITIIPKGVALWITWSIDSEEKNLRSPNYILKEIQWLVAWRIAEEIWLKKITTWSSNDYERATSLAFSYFQDYNFKYKWYQWLTHTL